ncbi:hypothetical protein OHAE_797 [Ochrobactrum soli]|uniref:Uncharacterized protein n=1 Tax=Ochrobactrum soli TaxID=2448455 RepID=A0A2P9HM49_9HYPH|nr:hypothetical protein OHAE_797 [[Ochrobactrum] soli]
MGEAPSHAIDIPVTPSVIPTAVAQKHVASDISILLTDNS